MINKLIFSPFEAPKDLHSLVLDFLDAYKPIEAQSGNKALLNKDEKSGAFYISCHIRAAEFVDKADFNATIDGSDEDEIYKLNRDITENQVAYSSMVKDAKGGRSFEDIVVEFDKTYNTDRPLKIYGGQHRVKAIEEARDTKSNILHGFRVYFGLTKEQKVEIATINNTSITVSNDLLDRMKEQLIGPELREYCQAVGLLGLDQDFADKKDPLIPTVRIARTFILNFLKGKETSSGTFHVPVLCKSGGFDEEYQKIRASINWKDQQLLEAGKQFSRLHQVQKQKITDRKKDNLHEYARKAFSLAVVASWAYAVGHLCSDKQKQNTIFSLCENLGAEEDPLNAKALSEARMPGTDPDTYRGLGARNSPDELGRMLEVFLVLVKTTKDKKISKNLANAAIQSFEAKKATANAEKLMAKL